MQGAHTLKLLMMSRFVSTIPLNLNKPQAFFKHWVLRVSHFCCHTTSNKEPALVPDPANKLPILLPHLYEASLLFLLPRLSRSQFWYHTTSSVPEHLLVVQAPAKPFYLSNILSS